MPGPAPTLHRATRGGPTYFLDHLNERAAAFAYLAKIIKKDKIKGRKALDYSILP